MTGRLSDVVRAWRWPVLFAVPVAAAALVGWRWFAHPEGRDTAAAAAAVPAALEILAADPPPPGADGGAPAERVLAALPRDSRAHVPPGAALRFRYAHGDPGGRYLWVGLWDGERVHWFHPGPGEDGTLRPAAAAPVPLVGPDAVLPTPRGSGPMRLFAAFLPVPLRRTQVETALVIAGRSPRAQVDLPGRTLVLEMDLR